MEISSLSSGSSGNAFLIKQGSDLILIDAGISCRQIVSKINLLNENPNNLRAIFLTHSHSDHIKGADVLSRAFNIPIYTTAGTLKRKFICANTHNIFSIKNNETVKISDLEIRAFPKSHDCLDPVSFNINCIKTKKSVSIITDIGSSNKYISESISDADFLAIESNYDLKMLESGPYPYFLKKRISSKIGHFSNNKSALTVLEHANSKIKKIILCHLSEVNNNPHLALNCFKKFLKQRKDLNPEIKIAPRYIATDMFRV